MSNIKVNTEQLTGYGTTLDSKSAEFSSVKSAMEDIVSALSGGWDGYDAQNFISNATAYLNNLKAIEQALLVYGNSVKNHSVKYSNRCADFYSMLG